jgi:hypothetical protein
VPLQPATHIRRPLHKLLSRPYALRQSTTATQHQLHHHQLQRCGLTWAYTLESWTQTARLSGGFFTTDNLYTVLLVSNLFSQHMKQHSAVHGQSNLVFSPLLLTGLSPQQSDVLRVQRARPAAV